MYDCALFSKVESLITYEGKFCGMIKHQLSIPELVTMIAMAAGFTFTAAV